MDPSTYKIIHLIGLMGLFSALGGLIGADVRKPATLRVYGMIHGISLLALLVSGVGMQTKYFYSMGSLWIIGKIVIWLFLGASIVILKRRLMPVGAAWALIIVLGAAAAILAIQKPGHKAKEIKTTQVDTSLITR
ncbi:hypothetical protein N9133_02075 [Akkermansiaceae bacterium]|nr:hypothetical protein [Akkermansiaceae bacterium]MDB4319086.1 hypothetical protein [bacterium]MDB4377753.1 hypothetical protein [Akkermansiaceae bacterium]MDB4412247.1 hypothetical protein [Akkermansiaceae bacterium]MDB4454025.1 hypothetical protein [bacterium]